MYACSGFIEYLENLSFESFEESDSLDSEAPKIQYSYDLGNIRVDIYPAQNLFDIYFVFSYYDVRSEIYDLFETFVEGEPPIEYDELYSNLMEDISKYWLLKELKATFPKVLSEIPDEYYMCPGSNDYVGYCNLSIQNEAVVVEKFVEVYKNCCKKYNSNSLEDAIFEILSDYCCSKDFKFVDNKGFINPMNNLLITNDLLYIQQKYKTSQKYKHNVSQIYYGKEYILLKTEKSKVVAFSKQCFSDFEEFSFLLGWFCDTKYFVDDDGNIFVTNKLIHMFIQANNSASSYLDLEYMYLIDSFEKFSAFRKCGELKIIDFSHLDPASFENLCHDFLEAAGFQNIHPIGNANASDGGKDLLAEEIITGLAGIEKRVYIIQCKYRKTTSLSRENVLEIDTLLRENNAEKYLLICSNDLTPQTIDRLEKQNERRTNKVVYWGKIEFAARLQKFPYLISRYKLFGKPNSELKMNRPERKR